MIHFWLEIILSVEDKTDNYEMKFILTNFLLFFLQYFVQRRLTINLEK